MLNLLTEESKRRIRKIYLLRLSIVCLFLTLGLTVFGIILLVPSYLVSSVKEDAASDSLASIKKSNDQILDQSLQGVAQTLNNKISILLPDKPFVLAEGGFISYLITDKPKYIYIDSIFYDKKSETAMLRGLSKDRESLLLFIKVLEKKENFFQVDLPISNLVKDVDIEFTIKINLKDE